MKFATRKEQRKVIETINAILCPLMPHLKEDEADAVRTAITILQDVLPQTKSGKWIETSLTPISGGDFNRGFKCSCCGYVVVVDDFNYCPNCGADMREVD